MASLIEGLGPVGGLLRHATRGLGLAHPYIISLASVGTPIGLQAVEQRLIGVKRLQGSRLSANEIIRQVRQLGLSVRRQDALRLIRDVRGLAEGHGYVNSLTAGARPRRDLLPLGLTRQRERYHVTIGLRGIDGMTGEERVQFVTVTSNRLITKSQASEIAIDAVLGKETYALTDIVDHEIVSYTRQNPDLQT